jgi:hypothetical protein
MPFQSKAQQGFLFAKHPAIAKRWAAETPDIKSLPAHVKQGNHRRSALLAKMTKGQP